MLDRILKSEIRYTTAMRKEGVINTRTWGNQPKAMSEPNEATELAKTR
jgi:hypothetical protein